MKLILFLVAQWMSGTIETHFKGPFPTMIHEHSSTSRHFCQTSKCKRWGEKSNKAEERQRECVDKMDTQFEERRGRGGKWKRRGSELRAAERQRGSNLML